MINTRVELPIKNPDYNKVNFCASCKIAYPKSVLVCQKSCGKKIRTKSKKKTLTQKLALKRIS